MAACPAYHAWDCHGNNYSLHLAWETVGYAPFAVCLLPVAGRHDLRVYASGHADEENLCVEVQGVVVAIP